MGPAARCARSMSYLVQLTVAECLADIALVGKRLLNLAQKEKLHEARARAGAQEEASVSVESNYREDMKRLRSKVHKLMEMAMSDPTDDMPAVGLRRGAQRSSPAP